MTVLSATADRRSQRHRLDGFTPGFWTESMAALADVAPATKRTAIMSTRPAAVFNARRHPNRSSRSLAERLTPGGTATPPVVSTLDRGEPSPSVGSVHAGWIARGRQSRSGHDHLHRTPPKPDSGVHPRNRGKPVFGHRDRIGSFVRVRSWEGKTRWRSPTRRATRAR